MVIYVYNPNTHSDSLSYIARLSHNTKKYGVYTKKYKMLHYHAKIKFKYTQLIIIELWVKVKGE